MFFLNNIASWCVLSIRLNENGRDDPHIRSLGFELSDAPKIASFDGPRMVKRFSDDTFDKTGNKIFLFVVNFFSRFFVRSGRNHYPMSEKTRLT